MTKPKRLFVGRKKCEDRFTIISDYDGEIGVKENRSGDVIVLMHDDLNAEQFVAQLVVFLNDQNQAIVDLYDGSKYWSDKATERIKELEKENEQLKQTIREVTELLTDEVDVFSDKAIEHDINAYMELKELDNKDAFYMAKATKTAIKMLKGDVE